MTPSNRVQGSFRQLLEPISLHSWVGEETASTLSNARSSLFVCLSVCHAGFESFGQVRGDGRVIRGRGSQALGVCVSPNILKRAKHWLRQPPGDVDIKS